MNNPNAGCCRLCGGWFSAERKALGYDICLWCGEEEAERARKSWTVAPMNKSNYVLITNREELKGLNPKANNVSLTTYMQILNELGESSC